MRKRAISAILFLLSIRRKLLQIDTSTREYKLKVLALRQEPEGLAAWRNEAAKLRRRGIVFAASRCAGRDGAGTLRAPMFYRGQRVRRRPTKLLWSHGTKSESFRYRANLASEQRPIFSVLATRPLRFRTSCVLRMGKFSFDFSFGER